MKLQNETSNEQIPAYESPVLTTTEINVERGFEGTGTSTHEDFDEDQYEW